MKPKPNPKYIRNQHYGSILWNHLHSTCLCFNLYSACSPGSCYAWRNQLKPWNNGWKPWKNQWTPWKNRLKPWTIDRNHGKIDEHDGTVSENHGKIEWNHGTTTGKSIQTMGKRSMNSANEKFSFKIQQIAKNQNIANGKEQRPRLKKKHAPRL